MPRLVVADTGPINHLVRIGRAELLPRLLGAVAIPATVAAELRHPGAPGAVRRWAEAPPAWLALHPDPPEPTPALPRLDPGERAAIGLALGLGAGLVLMDDRAGVAAARGLGLRVTGTLGLLVEASREGLDDLPAAFAALQAAGFRAPPALLAALLHEHRRARPG